MNTKLVAAMACVAALALGACAGGAPAPTTPTTPDEPSDPGTDARTEAQRTFDTMLTAAQATLATARAGATTALEQARAADTAAKRTAATTALTAAETALERAVAAIKALAVPSGDANRRGRKEAAATAADAALAAGKAEVTAGRAAVTASANAGTWFGGAAYSPSYRGSTPAVTVVRRARNTGASPDADHDDVLDAQSFPVVQYAAGKYVISAGQPTGGEWLPMRGHEVSKKRAGGALHHYEIHSDGQDTDLGSPNPTSVLIAGMKIAPTGLMMQLGGKSTIDLDFVRDIANVRTSRLTSGVDTQGWDLTLTFGTPGASPDGNGEYYWTAPLYKDASQRAQDWSDDTGGGARDNPLSRLGTYSIWLSNLVAADYGFEPHTGDGSNPGDDAFRYLKYAAYGTMTLAPAQNLNHLVSGRIHAFYVGYDAFKDEAGMQADDIGANKITDAKFVGRTIGFTTPTQLTAGAANAPNLVDVDGARRLRGDVELTVTISDATQRITDGSIKNLQYWDGISGSWAKLASIPSRIDVEADDIDPGGTFNPVIRVRNAADRGNDATYDRPGRLFGAFLGPQNDLEAAGWWGISTGGPPTASSEGLIGSFGAKQQPAASAAEN